MLKGILNFAHYLLEESIQKDETVIDATCGNGNDTVFLSKIVGDNGHVLAFDVQDQAISTTKELLIKHSCTNVSLIKDSHGNITQYLSPTRSVIGGAIFNLGYLPKSDKSIITKSESTIAAVNSILKQLKKDGLIVVVVYYGHSGGQEEKESLLKHVINLNQKEYNVMQYGFINQKNDPPFVLAIQKK
ncbi:class I SAM-dependent methyltransferase [Virgibacillus sp. C22-A2]|uniref:Class I SAM-dependent methyltransferase n=1 Tax=Virgibacillus tibetensis TaxID=3042313 RepID=A0ABU6KIE0_9BACI|nr:class I SAM-dependent methyltransferase [Virgibacillus sp. C22-A2]